MLLSLSLLGGGVEALSSVALHKRLCLIRDWARSDRARDVLRRDGFVDGFVIVSVLVHFLGIVGI